MAIGYVEAAGLLAGALTTVSFLPQIIRVYRRRSAGDISWAWMGVFFSGIFLWVVYGMLSGSVPVIAANGATFALGIVLIALKLKYSRGKDNPSARRGT